MLLTTKLNCFSMYFYSSLAKNYTTFSKKKKKTKKLPHIYNQLIYIYFYDSFLIFSISLSPLYVFFHSSQAVWWVLYRFPSPKSLLMLAPIPTPRCITILLIIYFYLFDITYKYNKLLLIWQKCMITYLIIFIYAFNGCCLTDL